MKNFLSITTRFLVVPGVAAGFEANSGSTVPEHLTADVYLASRKKCLTTSR